MNLIQDKLDVKNKTRANLFNWRGQFTPEFVDYILECFTHPDDVVLDPFSGSGTVLLECAKRSMSSYGFEINPAAYAMSRFFSFANLSAETRLDIALNLEEKILRLIPKFHNLPLFLERALFRESYRNLLEFSSALFSLAYTPHEKILSLNTLFIAESNNKEDLNSSIIKSFNYIKKSLLDLPFNDKVIDAKLVDARLIHKSCPTMANVILTSPPYINVFNYHQNYRAILERFGFNLLKVAQSEFGSNRKNRSNRFKTVVQYCLDIEQAIKSFWGCLDKNGLIIMVVGRESNIRSVPFYNGEIILDIVIETEGFKDIKSFERGFTNRFGNNIREDIIVFRKGNTQPSISKARDVSLKHLRCALVSAPYEVKEDIINAIDNIETIEPSPLFNAKGVFLDDQDTA
jgi:DNA modification methylase